MVFKQFFELLSSLANSLEIFLNYAEQHLYTLSVLEMVRLSKNKLRLYASVEERHPFARFLRKVIIDNDVILLDQLRVEFALVKKPIKQAELLLNEGMPSAAAVEKKIELPAVPKPKCLHEMAATAHENLESSTTQVISPKASDYKNEDRLADLRLILLDEKYWQQYTSPSGVKEMRELLLSKSLKKLMRDMRNILKKYKILQEMD